MTDKIIYFTEAEKATDAEKLDIEKLNSITAPYYNLQVRNGRVPNVWGSLEQADLVAGTVPDEYSEVDTVDPDNLPVPGIVATKAVVANGQVITIGTATYTFTVADGVVTNIVVGTTGA